MRAAMMMVVVFNEGAKLYATRLLYVLHYLSILIDARVSRDRSSCVIVSSR